MQVVDSSRGGVLLPKDGVDESILDLPAHAESGACPDSAPTNQAPACLIREPAIHGRRKLRMVQSLPNRGDDARTPRWLAAMLVAMLLIAIAWAARGADGGH